MRTKDKIQIEALRLFARKGYSAVSVAEIADAVGIKAPSLYKHYKSKRAIFESIIEKMNSADAENAQQHDMPEQTLAEKPESYDGIDAESICAYSEEMLRYWTENEYACCFRRMLELEQYGSPEMRELYQKYISGGPVQYMTDVFGAMPNAPQDAYAAAVEFYGAMFLMYKLFDEGENIERLCAMLNKHTKEFFQKN